MHDPMTVAFEIRYPWRQRKYRNHKSKFQRNYRASFITIWHKDPEADGTDDSCDWAGRKFSRRQVARIKDLVNNPDDNVQWMFSGTLSPDYEMGHAVFVIAAQVRRIIAPRPWYRHPRWHIWHWHVQVHPVQKLKRWAFSRCAGCGQRFTWGYTPVSHSWRDSGGPRWFRGEPGVYHRKCLRTFGTAKAEGD